MGLRCWLLGHRWETVDREPDDAAVDAATFEAGATTEICVRCGETRREVIPQTDRSTFDSE